ncbi:hypothetical protein [Burkholderia sp. LMG 32019]|uniref:hypothetical protein n=1 Tax=Burkholderia sp. LMG 32019 TaxID=3158173 RepID=UPI003C2D2DC5
MAANSEQIASMFRITYSSESADGRTKPDFTINDTASDWLWWWHRYFKENADYKAYCEARRDEDRETCAELESRFERIAELYEDWGDIHTGKRLHKNESSWREWLYERRHLFFVEVPTVKMLSALADVEHGAIAIQIPATVSKEALLQALTEFVERDYVDLRVAPRPKYELYAPGGRIDQSTFQTVKKSFYVHTAAQQHVWFPPSNAGTALEVMALELKSQLGFNWELEPDQEERLRNGTLSMLELEAFKRQVGRYKAQFDAYVANTIHGLFPKK